MGDIGHKRDAGHLAIAGYIHTAVDLSSDDIVECAVDLPIEFPLVDWGPMFSLNQQRLKSIWTGSATGKACDDGRTAFDPDTLVKKKRFFNKRLGAYLPVQFQQIRNYEKGTNSISAANLAKLAVAFGRSLEEFFKVS